MKYITFFLMILTAVLASKAFAESAVSEERLQKCYETHPLFLESLMLIGDDDFANQDLSKVRRTNIRAEIKKDRPSLKACYLDIYNFAKAMNDPENLNHVTKRMSEVAQELQKTEAPSTSQPAAPGIE